MTDSGSAQWRQVSDAAAAFPAGRPVWNRERPVGETIGAGALTMALIMTLALALAMRW
jgi:hypothetical protein